MSTLLAFALGSVLGAIAGLALALWISFRLIARHRRKVAEEIETFTRLAHGIQRESDLSAHVN